MPRKTPWGRLLSPMDIACAILDEEMEGDFGFTHLIDVFGEEGTIRFMKAFSGTTLRVPAKQVIKRAMFAAT